LNSVSKGLTAYLDSKRLAFPRFFFLSDEELLQILSQTKDPRSVQPHLPKCFENIYQLVFSQKEGSRVEWITAIMSGEGETFPLSQPFVPEGSVENWLLMVESMMKSSVRDVMRKALVDYVKVPRIDWVQKWPGQIVIAGSQVNWTMQVAQGIQTGTMESVCERLQAQLDDLVVLVRRDLPKLLRMVLSDLIVIEVHARDVAQRIKEAGVKDINDFEWVSQLRYEWLDQEDRLLVKILNATFPYGNEYLGNTGRLVITPLTDRCYLTLAMAMNLNMGGAPAGKSKVYSEILSNRNLAKINKFI
jgi:dynein heavy chain